MPLTAEEKVRIRFHLGYPGQSTLQSMFAGLPTSTESNWQINAILAAPLEEETLPLVRNVLKQLDDILFTEMPEARLMHAAKRLEELELNMEHMRMLGRDYAMWQTQLAKILSALVNPDMSGVGDALGGGFTNFSVN